MAATSLPGKSAIPCLPAQYCITMDNEAAPHPSRGWDTNGTSIHIADGACANAAQQTPSSHIRTALRLTSVDDGDDDDDGDQHNDQGQHAGAQHTRRELLLCIGGPRREIREFAVRKSWDRLLHLHW